jgi:WD40 repeat protein
MQPIYLTGHSRPVRKVMFNQDGDLLFTCSDDGNICMYNTYDCARVGVFNVKEAIKSMDVTKDSRYVLAAGVTFGFCIYNTLNGEELIRTQVPVRNIQTKHIEFAQGDQQFLILYDHNKRSYIRVYDFKKALQKNVDGEKEITGPEDHIITQASWGPLNKTMYVATDKGRFLIHDWENNKIVNQVDVHKSEIFSFTVTYDHTMLITCSRDGMAKLLHPKTLEPVRVFEFVKPCRAACISPLFDSAEL